MRIPLEEHKAISAATLVACLFLSGCGLKHHGGEAEPSRIMGTWRATCVSVGGSASGSQLGTTRSLHVAKDGTATFDDETGAQRITILNGGGDIYSGTRALGGGSIEETYIDLGHVVLRIARHVGAVTTPVYYGTEWQIVQTSTN